MTCFITKLLSKLLKLNDSNEIKSRQYYNAEGSKYVSRYALLYASRVYDDENSTYKGKNAFERDKQFFDDDILQQMYGLEHYKGGFKEFTVKEGIKRLGNYSFAYNLNLERIELPRSLEKIGNYAFAFCHALKEITIPQNVIRIGDNAFDLKVEKIYLQCSKPPKITDLGISSYCRIYVPKLSSDIYIKNRHWKKYKKQIYGYE